MSKLGSAPRRIGDAPDLVSLCGTDASLFVSPQRALLAQGIDTTLHAQADARLPARAASLLELARRDGLPAPLLVGAVPFRHDARAHLLLPQRVMHAAPRVASGTHERSRPNAAKPRATMRMQPTPERYRVIVADALADIRAQRFDKVVLSRTLTVKTGIDSRAALQRLIARNPRGYTFSIDLSSRSGRDHTLIGASPELLLARRGRLIVSNPLAGSIPRSADPFDDRERADALLRSAKDRHEHALVVDAVANVLRPYCTQLDAPPEPSLLSTPTMWHLSTEIHGELADPSTTSLELAMALHPTPAVCGHPPERARAFIEASEGFDRGLFTGLVGWCDAHGDGEWAVTIRCAKVSDDDVTLFAGAGIVAGSDPALELAETTAKLRTMLGALQLDTLLENEP